MRNITFKKNGQQMSAEKICEIYGEDEVVEITAKQLADLEDKIDKLEFDLEYAEQGW